MFSRIGAAAFKPNLDNTIALCEFLDNPQTKFKSIHIAGTNGKGSTSHMLAAILQQAGYKTGLYTSPHLSDFRERIKINGEIIPEETVIAFTEKTIPITEKIEPSFFELTVAMAFDHFAKEQVDIAVIETGLGGRLDSTNVITPLVSVITNIGFDHMNLLGNTLPEIASEKAGIIKPGVPVVIGATLPETRPVFASKAASLNAPIYFAEDIYQTSNIQYGNHLLQVDITDIFNDITESFSLDLNGLYQVRNLCTVLCAEGLLVEHGFDIPGETEKYALSHVKQLTGLHGRWELIREKPLLVLDVGHNEDGIKAILANLQQVRYERLHIITGMVNDKDIDKVLSLLPKTATYYFTNAHIPRALPFAQLVERAKLHELYGEGYDDVNDAVAAALKKASVNDMILVCGSVFVVGEVDQLLITNYEFYPE
jgi:dihydrofolate synthase/folylpolyglutamate synthase